MDIKHNEEAYFQIMYIHQLPPGVRSSMLAASLISAFVSYRKTQIKKETHSFSLKIYYLELKASYMLANQITI
jgi:hypothetical protein